MSWGAPCLAGAGSETGPGETGAASGLLRTGRCSQGPRTLPASSRTCTHMHVITRWPSVASFQPSHLSTSPSSAGPAQRAVRWRLDPATLADYTHGAAPTFTG